MIAIPNMEMPKGCRWCPLNHDSMCYVIQPYKADETNGEQRRTDCPLIEIDESDTELLQFFKEFEYWKTKKDVAKYISAVYGERANADQHTQSVESVKEPMSKLEKAKDIIKSTYKYGSCGLFDSKCLADDPMIMLYNSDGLTVNLCYDWEYFEVFGLTNMEFKELKDYYNSIEEADERRAEQSQINTTEYTNEIQSEGESNDTL